MTDKKYQVPALVRANEVLKEISQHSGELRLIDLSHRLSVNKSSLYTLLSTMADLDWVRKEKGGTYTLGPVMAVFSTSFLRQFDVVQTFYREAPQAEVLIEEPLQIGTLDGGDVLYLGKMESAQRIQLITNPGMKFPAYASSLGKAQLMDYSLEQLKELYPSLKLEQKTEFTISTVEALYENLQSFKEKGYIEEKQESSIGFYCVGAPIYNHENKVIAGVSFTMLEHSWERKRDQAIQEIKSLAQRISAQSGYRLN